MKKLWHKLFKNKPQFSYTMADYQPIKINTLETKVKVTEYEIDARLRGDEMEIDKLHQQQ